MTTIKIFEWPYEMWFLSADIGYSHASVAGEAYFTGRPQGQSLALPKRVKITASGSAEHKGVIEAVRYSLSPANLVSLPDPNWPVGRSASVRALASSVRWSRASWASARWGHSLSLSDGYAAGDSVITIRGTPPSQQIVRHGDLIGLGGVHYMVKSPAVSDANGTVTVSLVRPIESALSASSPVEYPVKHLFSAKIAIPTDQQPVLSYDWAGTMTEVFQSEYDNVTFENASFFS